MSEEQKLRQENAELKDKIESIRAAWIKRPTLAMYHKEWEERMEKLFES